MATKKDDHTSQDSGDNDNVKFDNLPNFRRIRGTRVFRSSAPDSLTLQGQWLFCSSAPNSITLQGQWLFRSSAPDSLTPQGQCLLLLLCTQLNHSTRSVVIFAPLCPTQSLYKVGGYFCFSASNSITL